VSFNINLDVDDADNDDDADDVNDGDNRSSIPSDFLTSSSFVPPQFVSTLLSSVFNPSVPSLPSTVSVHSVSFVPPISSDVSVLSTARFTPPPNKFGLTVDQVKLIYSDVIGEAEPDLM
jgi:hypothetical protein